MKNIDVKSLIIGALLTCTIFLGVAAAPKDTGTYELTKKAWVSGQIKMLNTKINGPRQNRKSQGDDGKNTKLKEEK